MANAKKKKELMEMKKYYVVWFYRNQHGMETVCAPSPVEAAVFMRCRYTDRFRASAQIAVFDSSPYLNGCANSVKFMSWRRK